MSIKNDAFLDDQNARRRGGKQPESGGAVVISEFHNATGEPLVPHSFLPNTTSMDLLMAVQGKVVGSMGDLWSHGFSAKAFVHSSGNVEAVLKVDAPDGYQVTATFGACVFSIVTCDGVRRGPEPYCEQGDDWSSKVIEEIRECVQQFPADVSCGREP
ncbi:MAG: hypothetical protein H6861_05455 [Rhodospirillales bacterium]|nr:hypothetical protein [Rhodospirillales bacterium]